MKNPHEQEWQRLCANAKRIISRPNDVLTWDMVEGNLPVPDPHAPPIALWVHPHVHYDLVNSGPEPLFVNVVRRSMWKPFPLEDTGLGHDTYDSLLLVGTIPFVRFITKSSIGVSAQ